MRPSRSLKRRIANRKAAAATPAATPTAATATAPATPRIISYRPAPPLMPAYGGAWIAEPRTVWHPQINLPRAVMSIFMDPVMYAGLCTGCQTLQNIGFNRAGVVRGVFCTRCRSVLGRHPAYACPGCGRARFVDELGRPPPHCRDCYSSPG